LRLCRPVALEVGQRGGAAALREEQLLRARVADERVLAGELRAHAAVLASVEEPEWIRRRVLLHAVDRFIDDPKADLRPDRPASLVLHCDGERRRLSRLGDLLICEDGHGQ